MSVLFMPRMESLYSQGFSGEPSSSPESSLEVSPPPKERAEREARRMERKHFLESLTPEQRQQLQEFRRKAKDMTPEQRHQELAKMPFLNDIRHQQRKDRSS